VPLSDDDIREILRLIDESDLDELTVENEVFSLHVRRAPAGRPPAPEPVSGGASEAPAPARTTDRGVNLRTIASPLLGVFYRAPAPGAAPFVAVGARVAPDTVVCLIEVMKMMNSVPAGIEGTVVEVCVENAELVESGDTLFLVEPDR
jgi:acetyl-CoA carboxylase biotin carboxyl carrier protein